MLVRFLYLAVANAFAALRLLLLSDRQKAVEILALWRQLSVLQRQLDGGCVWFEPADPGLWPRCLVRCSAGRCAAAVVGEPGYGAAVAPQPGARMSRGTEAAEASGVSQDGRLNPAAGASFGPEESRLKF